MVVRGFDHNNLLLSKFIDTCSVLGLTDYGYSVFTHKTHPDIYLFNTMIKALSRTNSPKEAIVLYNRIHVMGYRPDTYSFPFVLKAVVHLSAVELGREIHGQSIRIGLEADVHVMTGLIQMYSACGIILDACHLFDGMPIRDVVTWNAMVAGYAKVGDMESARGLFEKMPDRNVISWTTMVAGYAQTNQPNKAIQVFQRMQLEDIEPDEIAMLAALSACAHLGALELGKWIHEYIDNRGLYKMVPLNNALIDMYVKSGSIEKGLEVFEKMKHRSVVTWTTIIAGLALHGFGNKALEMFSCMERERVRPNAVTFVAILSACSHVGLVEMGRKHFNNMSSQYQITPKIEHYGCMIDLLGRAGKLREANELLRQMPYEPNGAIWGSLLAASRVHGDVKLGECALKHLLEVEPHNSGNYTLLSNIYAASGRWHEVGIVRKGMRDKGVKKNPGGSSIEVNNVVHEFIAGDNSHVQFERIQGILYVINRHFKMAGYVPKECRGLLEHEEA
ncbi:Pentatricopeptide repeat-containing protein [Thalictrum thalictroides]|uniref:Pentatricopeptide repeat-containing protein n=1 Tax=Thalictrum thalictroides TaxID=46969 RepID=A0A7J6W7I0_THATH|nr:Pentatricopeptide repeat-containing protein [Thalictrum thalictroides]